MALYPWLPLPHHQNTLAFWESLLYPQRPGRWYLELIKQRCSWVTLEQKAKNSCMGWDVNEIENLQEQQIKTRSALGSLGRRNVQTSWKVFAFFFFFLFLRLSSSQLYVNTKWWVTPLTSQVLGIQMTASVGTDISRIHIFLDGRITFESFIQH